LDLKIQLKKVFAVLGAVRIWGKFDPRKKEMRSGNGIH